MNAKFKICFPVLVCSGAGCKAWDSDVLIQKLKNQNECSDKRSFILPTKCLNNCGGGVTVKVPSSKKLIKVRNPNQLREKINEIISENNIKFKEQ